MKKILRKFLIAGLVLAQVLSFAACAPKASEPSASGALIKVGIVNLPPEESGYRQANVEDMNAVFSTANGYDMSQTNTADNSEQIAAAEGYIRDGVDYLLISAANATGWDSVLASAKEAGVVVFLFDRFIETDPSNYQAALVSDTYAEGNTAMEWLLNQGLDEYNVILIRGQLGSAAELGRSDAVLKADAAGKIKIVADGTGGDSWSGEEARKVVEAAIQSGISFNVIYAENDGMADGAVQALDAAGITHGKGGDVIIMGFDFNRFALRNVQAGIWNYDGQCSPRQASKISEWIKAREAGQSIPSGTVYLEEIGVDCDTITEDIIVNMGINEDPGKLTAGEPTASGEPIKVGIVNLPPEESGYRQANVEDMNAVFSAANGYDMSQTNTADNSEQIAAAEGYIRDGVDYLLISAANATGWDGVLASAKEAGVKVFLFDRLIETDVSNYQAALVSDMAAEGTTAVNWLLGQGLSEYNVILIRGQLGSAAELGRSEALLKAEQDGKLKIVADGTGGDSWSGEEARKVVEAAIQAGTSFNVIYAQNDGMADGAVQALDAAGITHGKGGDVIVMGFDFNRFALRNVQAGIWNYDGQCSPRQAAKISEWIQALEAGQSIPGGIVFNEEIGVDTDTITEDIIVNMGINEDPGKLG